MMPTIVALALCGAAGALTYSFPLYLKALSQVPPGKFALHTMVFSIFVGAICAAVFTRVIGANWTWTVNPEPWPLALVIGLASNPLAPIILRRLEAWAERVTPGGK